MAVLLVAHSVRASKKGISNRLSYYLINWSTYHLVVPVCPQCSPLLLRFAPNHHLLFITQMIMLQVCQSNEVFQFGFKMSLRNIQEGITI